MTIKAAIVKIVHHEALNFLLTNRIPRRLATRFMGWFSKIEHPVIRDASIAVWRFFSDLDLGDAKEKQFRSMHDCFTRQLKDGARPIDMDPRVLVSPCDAIVGAAGTVEGGQVLQVKGSPYALSDLLLDHDHAESFRNGSYVTLRLTSSMYHRFHAPYDCCVQSVTHIFGDTWNVNPIALKRVGKLFCRNERAVIRTRLSGSDAVVTLVPVAAILVAGIRLHFIPTLAGSATLDRSATWGRSATLGSSSALGSAGAVRRTVACDASLRKGEEMGWFEHGSTIIVLAPEGFRLCESVREGCTIRVGQPLMWVVT